MATFSSIPWGLRRRGNTATLLRKAYGGWTSSSGNRITGTRNRFQAGARGGRISLVERGSCCRHGSLDLKHPRHPLLRESRVRQGEPPPRTRMARRGKTRFLAHGIQTFRPPAQKRGLGRLTGGDVRTVNQPSAGADWARAASGADAAYSIYLFGSAFLAKRPDRHPVKGP